MKIVNSANHQDWTLITAANDESILNRCLLSSPDVRFAFDVKVQKGFLSAAKAYNAAIENAKTDLLVFVHQDVYLPDGWISKVQSAIDIISDSDPNWGVLGVWGTRVSGERFGFVYDGSWQLVLGTDFSGGVRVDSLDEVVLILRKSAGLKFDWRIPGFHMYGTDICYEAKRRGKNCFAIAAFCIHNTRQYGLLPWQFWRSYLAMRRKWKSQLPIRTGCIEITKWCWPMLRWNLVRAINLTTGRDKPPTRRVEDPAKLYREIIHVGRNSELA